MTTDTLSRLVRGLRVALVVLITGGVAVTPVHATQDQKWFSAWTVSHGLRLTAPVLSGSTVRMIMRPTISGTQLRVKVENTMGESPVAFTAAYVGKAGFGAAVVDGSNTRLTFRGSPGLVLGPGEGAYSDAVSFNIVAFEKLT